MALQNRPPLGNVRSRGSTEETSQKPIDVCPDVLTEVLLCYICVLHDSFVYTNLKLANAVFYCAGVVLLNLRRRNSIAQSAAIVSKSLMM